MTPQWGPIINAMGGLFYQGDFHLVHKVETKSFLVYLLKQKKDLIMITCSINIHM